MLPGQTVENIENVQVQEASQANAPEESAPRRGRPANPDGPIEKVQYPGLTDEAGNPVLLESFPADYDAKIHKPFRRKDFSDETIWLEWRADTLEKKAAKYREDARIIRQFGSSEQRKNAEKLLKLRQKFEDLKSSLGDSGVDVDAILASLAPQSDGEEG